MTEPAPLYDVLICGASHAGITLALALAGAAGDALRIGLLDRAAPLEPGERDADARAFALSAGTCNLLTSIGVWPRLAAVAEAVTAIDITDPKAGSPLREPVLSYDNHLDDGRVASSIVEADQLRRALIACLRQALAVDILADTEIMALEPLAEAAGLQIACTGGRQLQTRLLVGADGRHSRSRDLAGIKTVGWSYGQSSLVTIISHSRAHDGRATQHFFAGGPFAILPLHGGYRSGIVWTDQAAVITAAMASSGGEFEVMLGDKCGSRLGAITVAGPRQAHRLELMLARDLVASHVALVGDAVRSVHPLAGQGLNIGLRDVAALAEIIMADRRLGLPIGGPLALQKYARWRRSDGLQQALAFDGLNRAFGSDNTLLRSLRDAGLALVDRAPALKSGFVREAAGLAGDTPRLLRGLAL